MSDLEKVGEFVAIAPLGSCVLSDAFASIKARGEQVESVSLHPVDYADLLSMGGPVFLSHALTVDEQSEMLETGVWTKPIWGAKVEESLEETPGVVVVEGITTFAEIHVTR